MVALDAEIVQLLLDRSQDVRPIPRNALRHFGMMASHLSDTDSRRTNVMLAHILNVAVAGVEFLASVHRRYDHNGIGAVVSDVRGSRPIMQEAKELIHYTSVGDEMYWRTRPIIEKVRQAQSMEGSMQYAITLKAVAEAIDVLGYYRSHSLQQQKNNETPVAQSQVVVPDENCQNGRPDPKAVKLWHVARGRGPLGDPRAFLGLEP